MPKKLNFFEKVRTAPKAEERTFSLPDGDALTLRLVPIGNLQFSRAGEMATELLNEYGEHILEDEGAKRLHFGGIIAPPVTSKIARQVATIWAQQDDELPDEELYEAVEIIGICEQSGTVWDDICDFSDEMLAKGVSQKKTTPASALSDLPPNAVLPTTLPASSDKTLCFGALTNDSTEATDAV